MNINRLYDRINNEINNEKHLSESDKIMFKAIVLQCFADEQIFEFEEFRQSQLKFNDTLAKSCTNLDLINNVTKN
jgi:hypothetical protein